jgi:DNA-directed RNA polymerase subunit RPC12/RpoP
MLGQEKIEMKCPSCQKTLSYSVDQLQKGQSINCPHCGNDIRFEESSPGSVSKLEDKTKQALEDIEKKITVTIKE